MRIPKRDPAGDSSLESVRISRPLTLRQTQGSLESSEGLEKKILGDVVGSLKEPCKAGGPDMAIGTNGESLKPRTSRLILGFRLLPLSL